MAIFKIINIKLYMKSNVCQNAVFSIRNIYVNYNKYYDGMFLPILTNN